MEFVVGETVYKGLVVNLRSAQVRRITLTVQEQAALGAGGPHARNMGGGGGVLKGFHGGPSCIANR